MRWTLERRRAGCHPISGEMIALDEALAARACASAAYCAGWAPPWDGVYLRCLCGNGQRDDFKLGRYQLRHCEPPGRRVAPPDDRLREAIQGRI